MFSSTYFQRSYKKHDKRVHTALRQERDRQTKKKLGADYDSYTAEIAAIAANIKVQLQARNVRNPQRPIRTFKNSLLQAMEDDGMVDISELTESLTDFDIKLDYDSIKILEAFLDLEMNGKLVIDELFQLIENASRGNGKFSPVKKIPMGKSDDGLGVLPPNWEKGVTADGRVYFIDHAREVTQWEDPRKQSARPAGNAINAVRANR